MEKLIPFGKNLADYVSDLLAISTPRPNWDEKQGGWRHDIRDYNQKIILFLLLKLAGSISTSNAMLKLSADGYWFQSGILARSVRESNLSIAFMLPKPDMKAGDWPSNKLKGALDEFFKETWPDPARPFENASQRSQILLKELSAALGHFQGKDGDISPHDAGQVGIQMLRLLSDYTHAAYPRLMELLEAERGYVLCGQQRGITQFNASLSAGVLFDCCNTADIVAQVILRIMKGAYASAESKNEQTSMKKLQPKIDKVQELHRCLENLCREIESNFKVTTHNPKKRLKEFKGK